MSIRKYKTKNGMRYAAEVFEGGQRIAYQGGFLSKMKALEWESAVKKSAAMPKRLALFEISALYLQKREGRCKKNTLIYKKSVLRKLNRFIGPKTEFSTITKNDLEAFLEAAKEAVSAKSANKYRIELSALYSWAAREGYVPVNVARQTEPFATVQSVKYIPPEGDIAKLMACATGFERDFLICLLHTAGRISEIREMAWEDVDLENRTVRLWTSKRRGGNRESRTIAMSPTLYSVLFRLYALRENERFVFEAPGTGLPYPRTTPRIKYLMKRLCEKAGIPFFAAHSLRHFMATHFKDPRRAQKVLGHMNIRTTEIYLHDLGVDREAAGIFEDITHKITHSENECTKKGLTENQ